MKDEETIYDNEETQYDETQNNISNEDVAKEEKDNVESTPKKDSTWKKAATGLGMGILLGSTASFVSTSAASAEDNTQTNDDQSDTNDNDTNSANEHPAWTDGQIGIATSVSDDMSFSEAFSAARAEVGPGGAFEWHGNVYNTYTAEEWNNMSAAEKNGYTSHLAWNNHSGTETQPTNEEVEVVSVNESINNITASHLTEEDTVEIVDSTPDVEILGVTHDDETGANIGEMIIDNQEVFLVDVDNSDDHFEFGFVDINEDGKISENEIVDISDLQISVSQFESNSLGNDSLYASNDGITDYTNEIQDDVMA